MKYYIIKLIFILFFFNCFGQTLESIKTDSLVKANMETLGIPGMAVAVVKQGEILKLSGYGFANLEWNNKVTPHTNFQIASSTKLLTSTLLIKAMYNGKIKLEDHVSKFLDSIPEDWHQLQVKHLISHSSGLKTYSGNMFSSTPTVVNALKDSTLEYEPGMDQHYAQLDFMLLGLILEGIYGKPFTTLLKDEVTIPMNMPDGGFDMEQRVGQFLGTRIIKEKAATYYDLDGNLQAYKFIYPQYTYTAGGYFASISDMANWAVGLDKEILFTKRFSHKYIYERDSIGNKLSEFTRAGWAYGNEEGVLYAGHSGGPGLGDILRFPKEGYTFIVLTNDGEVLPFLAKEIASIYINDFPSSFEIKKFERQ